MLEFLAREPYELNRIGADAYIEPILLTLAEHFDPRIADLCANILQALSECRIWVDRSGPLDVILAQLQRSDNRGDVARLFFERGLPALGQPGAWFYTLQVAASITTVETARWLIQSGATGLIQNLAGYVSGPVREALRPYSGGVIDAQDANARRYAEEEQIAERKKTNRVQELQARLLARTTFPEALSDFQELGPDYWPELPEAFGGWLSREVSMLLASLDLGHSIAWKGETLWMPNILGLLLQLVDRYALPVTPDELMIFPAMGVNYKVALTYYQRFGLSGRATRTLERLLTSPPSERALEGLVGLVRDSGFSTDATIAVLRTIAADSARGSRLRAEVVGFLAQRGVPNGFFVDLRADSQPEIAGRALEVLAERGDRKTIERELARLLGSDAALLAGEGAVPGSSPLSWIAKVRADFAWKKLKALRERALRLQLRRVTNLLTDCLAQISYARTAQLIVRQLDSTPLAWRREMQRLVIDYELAARLDQAQRTPFEVVLQKLRRSTSASKLLVALEGPTDVPVFEALIAQVPGVTEISFDFVGGWSALVRKDPTSFLRGAKCAIVVMDGDNGRRLNESGRPLTQLAMAQAKRLTEVGVELRVLERFGIENYFPRRALEAVLQRNLSSYFPLPHDVPIRDHLSEGGDEGLRRTFYSKDHNVQVAANLELERDLAGTDLHFIVHNIAQKAVELASG